MTESASEASVMRSAVLDCVRAKRAPTRKWKEGRMSWLPGLLTLGPNKDSADTLSRENPFRSGWRDL